MITYNKDIVSNKTHSLKSGGPRDNQLRVSDQSQILIDELRNQIDVLRRELNSKQVGITPEELDEEIHREVNKVIIEKDQVISELQGKLSVLASINNKLEAEILKLTASRKVIEGSKQETIVKMEVEVEKKYVTLLEDANQEKIQLQKEHELKLDELSKLIAEKDVENRNLSRTLNERSLNVAKMVENQQSQIDRLTTLVNTSKSIDDLVKPIMNDIVIDPSIKGIENDFESHLDVKDVSITEKRVMNDKVNKLKALLGK